MNNGLVAIVLGGTVPHIELIRQLKSRGYYTVLVDFLVNPPAKEYADLHIRESTLDVGAVYKIAVEYKADLVIATCIDHANRTACAVLEMLGKHFPYSTEVARNVTDKQRMKKIMRENDILTADYVVVKSEKDKVDLPLPLVVKPVDSNGSRGIKKIISREQLQDAVVDALLASKTGSAIVERYVPGVEAAVYAYIQNGVASLILSNERQVYEDPETGKMPGFAMIYPCQEVQKRSGKIRVVCEKLAKAFDLDNTPLLVQMKITGDQIYVIELMPRIGGGQSYWNIKKLTQFDIISATIDSFLGNHVDVEAQAPSVVAATNNVYTKAGVFGEVLGGDDLLTDGTVDEFKILRCKGDEIKEDLTSGNRVCTYVVVDVNVDLVRERAMRAFKRVEVRDIDGEDMKRTDIFWR